MKQELQDSETGIINGNELALQNINEDTFDFYCCNVKPTCSSKYKYVSFCNKSQRWRAIVFSNKKQTFLGYFKTEIEAAEAVAMKLNEQTKIAV